MIINTDFNLGIDYELKVMSTRELRRKIMRDNRITNDDLFFYYTMKDFSKLSLKYQDLEGDFHSTLLYAIRDIKKNDLWQVYGGELKNNFNIKKFVGVKDISTIANELGFEGVETYEGLKEASDNKLLGLNPKIYQEVSYQEALLDMLNHAIEEFEAGQKIVDDVFKQGIENCPIIINEKPNGKIELVDGFYRLLYKEIDCNVVVKAYKNLTDEQWFKIMLNCNNWKTRHGQGLFYDRGFVLGLNARFGICAYDYHLEGNNVKHLVDFLSEYLKPISLTKRDALPDTFADVDYLIGMEADKFRNLSLVQPFFARDLKQIKDYLNYLPAKVLAKKSLSGIDLLTTSAYNDFIKLIIKSIFVFRLKNKDKTMNTLPVNLIDLVFENREVFESFSKAAKYSARGVYGNQLEHLIPTLQEILEQELLDADYPSDSEIVSNV